jgi:hypothetical protein
MALTSPGVQVSVVNESFYTPAEPGTVPVIFCATAQDKTNASGTGTALGTLAQNAGKPYLMTSQRDLAETFGDPTFKVDSNNNPIHGSEVNEYGLQAAYSFLGVSNRAWVVRAPIDLGQLEARSSVPTADPAAGTYWLDTTTSLFGIQEWNNADVTVTGGQTFTNKVPLVLTTEAQVTGTVTAPGAPLASIGEIGDYAVVAVNKLVTVWYRAADGDWVQLGSDEWRDSWPAVSGSKANPSVSASTFTLNDTLITLTNGQTLSEIVNAINGLGIGGLRAAAVDNRLAIYSDGTTSGDDSTQAGPVVIAAGTANDTTALTALGLTAGTYYPPALQISKHTQIPDSFKKTTGATGRPTGSIWLKTTEPNLGARWRVKLWNAETRLWDSIEAPMFASAQNAIFELDRTGGGENLLIGDMFILTNVAGDTLPLGSFKVFRRNAIGSTVIKSRVIESSSFVAGTYNITIQSTAPGSAEFSNFSASTIAVTLTGTESAEDQAIAWATAITSAGIPNVSAEVDGENRVVIKHSKGGEMTITDGSGSAASLVRLGIEPYVDANQGTQYVSYEPGTDSGTQPQVYRASNWQALNYTASATAPTDTAEDGQLWYNSIIDQVDIMIHNGTTWVGYQYDGSDSTNFGDAAPYYSAVATDKTDPNGPIIAATQPSKQSDGTELANGDLWIDSSDLENYPMIYRYRKATDAWELLDKADQTTENGVLFADARYGTSGANGNTAASIKDLLTNNYIDPDAPDPALYPKGMLLVNTRRSGFNVKKFVKNYIQTGDKNLRHKEEQMSDYNRDRWVTESGNQADGSGSFGRKAQRKVVVQSLQAIVNNNDEIRDDEARIFNLIACPGYPELIGEMINLNYDRGLTGFVVGDAPMRLTPDATSLNEWATNARLAAEDNDDGLVSRDDYFAVFYPAGFTSDNFGNNVVVPPSHMMLRTIALSDQVSYPWFAPAGTRRGGITNASATGYINDEGEFTTIALNEGQRDTLYAQGVNPITFITGAGLVNFGQKTRARGNSSLDRINVARLVIYLRSQLNTLAKPYIFEPNDKITRDEIKGQVESLLLELVGQRALYDFLVVCDETNNTPARVDRNELYVDVAIEPVKSIEFIYIPLRLKNTGEIGGL